MCAKIQSPTPNNGVRNSCGKSICAISVNQLVAQSAYHQGFANSGRLRVRVQLRKLLESHKCPPSTIKRAHLYSSNCSGRTTKTLMWTLHEE